MSSHPLTLTVLDPNGGWVNAPLHVHDLRGWNVVMYFWNRDHAQCHEMLAEVNRWSQDLGMRGVQAVGVHVPLQGTGQKALDTNAVETAARQHHLRHAIAVDDGAISQAYGVTGIPTILLFDGSGRLRHRASGDFAQLRSELERLVTQSEGSSVTAP